MIKQRLQKWLEIENPDAEKFNKVEERVRALNSNLDFWKRQFMKQQPTKKCTKCHQPIDLWPFNTSTSYYIKGNRVTHQTCPTPVNKGDINE